MILKTAKLLLTILSALAVLISFSSCKQESKLKTVPIPGLADTVQHEKAPPAKITATKADLCRIVMVQKRLVNENSPYDDHTNDVIVTLLSDGSGERVIANKDSIIKSLEKFYYDSICNFQENLFIGRNLDRLIFKVEYCDSKTRSIMQNYLQYNLLNKQSELLISETDYEYSIFDNPPRKPRRQNIWEAEFFPKDDILFIGKEFSLWTINCKNHRKTKYQRGLSLFNILPISANECYVNFFYPADTPNSKPHVGRFNIETQKIDALPAELDSFIISTGSISEDAKTILFFHDNMSKLQEGYDPIDTVFVFDNKFTQRLKFIVDQKNGTLFFRPDPKGKWLYYYCNYSLYRLRIADIRNEEILTVDDVIAKSQLIYQAPIKNDIQYSISNFFLSSVTE